MLDTRRATTRTFAALLLAILHSGCASTSDSTTAPPPAANDRISMARGPCFGACPIYTVTVWGDGRVVFVGERFVEQTGEHSKTIDPAAAAALFAYVDSVGFFALPADITPANEVACGGAPTDMPSAQIAVDWSERDHVVDHYHGCPKAPQKLTALENHIDAVLGVREWVGGS